MVRRQRYISHNIELPCGARLGSGLPRRLNLRASPGRRIDSLVNPRSWLGEFAANVFEGRRPNNEQGPEVQRESSDSWLIILQLRAGSTAKRLLLCPYLLETGTQKNGRLHAKRLQCEVEDGHRRAAGTRVRTFFSRMRSGIVGEFAAALCYIDGAEEVRTKKAD
jgi:hypothetical protein